MRAVEISLGIVTFVAAVVCEVLSHLLLDGVSATVMFVRIDAPLIMTVLAALLAIAIASARQYALSIVLVGALALVLFASMIALFYPLLMIPAALLLLTTIVSGLAMNRAWREEPPKATH